VNGSEQWRLKVANSPD